MILNDYLKDNGLQFPYNTEYSEEYANNETTIKTIMKNKYGTLPLKNDIAETSALIMATLFQYKYKLDKLWESTKIEYNPIWNVDGTETTTTVYGEHETTKNYGEKVSENVYGDKVSENVYGDKVSENVYGDKVSENVYGETSKTTTMSKYPYDSQTETPTDKENTIDNTHTDTLTDRTHADTLTDRTHTDTLTDREHIDMFTDSAHNDTDISKTHTDTVTLKREGNIGVTSTQKLLTEERSIANFSFWNVVLEMVSKEITIPYYIERSDEYEYRYWLY